MSIADRIAYNEGIKAGHDKLAESFDNPYDMDSHRGELWFRGYAYAQRRII